MEERKAEGRKAEGRKAEGRKAEGRKAEGRERKTGRKQGVYVYIVCQSLVHCIREQSKSHISLIKQA